MQPITLAIRGMSCGHCVASVREALGAVPGVDVRAVRVGSAEVVVPAPGATAAVLAAVRDAGYDAAVEPAAAPTA